MKRLKPCPFCGEKPLLKQYRNHESNENEKLFMVVCVNCVVGVYTKKNEAIEAWNRRSHHENR